MNQEITIPDGLTKHERRAYVKDWRREQQTNQAHKAKFTKYIIVATIIIGIAALGFWFFKEATKPLPGEFVVSLGNKHLDKITDQHDPYNSLPPTSGPHVGGKADWGVHSDPIPNELQIHNLEDGGVVVQYNCLPEKDSISQATESSELSEECKQLISELSDIVKKHREKVVLAPYPKLDTKIALTAWRRIDKFNDFDKERIEKFINSFKGIDHHKG